MRRVKINYQGVLDFISQEEINNIKQNVYDVHEMLVQKTGIGNDFLGWYDYASRITLEELLLISKTSEQIKRTSEVLVVIGIGGSYLGAKAAIDLLNNYFKTDSEIEVIFLGNTLSSDYTYEVLRYLENKDFSVNVISKSGTTTEPAIAFRLVRKLLEEKYPGRASERIYVTTDQEKGALRQIANQEEYLTFTLPSDIGGRFSVLTAVGLLPMAVTGVDIFQVVNGAKDAQKYFSSASFLENDALLYAGIRYLLHQNHHKDIEVLVSFEPNFRYFAEWWKQLFGESEGKNHKGLFPASLIYSTDLHSMGQYIQDGKRHLFETIISIKKPHNDLNINRDQQNIDELNYLTKYKLSEINNIAKTATKVAHIDGGVPVIEIELEEMNAYNFGYLVYFFMLAVGVSGYLLEVNPFIQEGVEDYKRNMFALLGKEEFLKLRKKLVNRLNEKNI